MTREDILLMARAAGLQRTNPGEAMEVVNFAALVATAEREACAKVAEGFAANRDWVPGSLWGNIRAEVAAAIRARGKP